MPLRIPPQWAIVFNTFVDEDPRADEDGDIDNWLSYKEGVLIIKQLSSLAGEWSTKQQGFSLDLSWDPDGKWPGEYHISLLKGDWENIIFEYRVPDRHQAQQAVEIILQLAHHYCEKEYFLYEFKKLFQA